MNVSIHRQFTCEKCGESDCSQMSQKFSCRGDMSIGLELRDSEISLIEVSIIVL